MVESLGQNKVNKMMWQTKMKRIRMRTAIIAGGLLFVLLGATPPPPPGGEVSGIGKRINAFTIDLFVIVHNESRSALFAGWISNPPALAQDGPAADDSTEGSP